MSWNLDVYKVKLCSSVRLKDTRAYAQGGKVEDGFEWDVTMRVNVRILH